MWWNFTRIFEKNLRAAYFREEMEGILELIVQMAFADLQQANLVIFLRDEKHVSLAEDDGFLSLF